MKTAVFLATAFITLSFNWGKAQTKVIMDQKKVILKENQVEIYYLQQGRGDTTLLFLHGWCINGSYWNHQITHFSRNYGVYALDLPGFGSSKASRENWTMENYAHDVISFIDQLDLKNVILIGHSMSGDIMLEAALNKDPRIIGLIGVDNYKFIGVEFTPEQKQEMAAVFQLLKDDFKNVAPAYAENFLFHATTNPEVKARVKNDFASADPKIGYGSFINLMQFSEAVPAKLEKLSLKLHLINSDAVPTNIEGLEKHCRNGFEVKYLKSTGHYPMIEKPAEFNQLLEAVLTSLN